MRFTRIDRHTQAYMKCTWTNTTGKACQSTVALFAMAHAARLIGCCTSPSVSLHRFAVRLEYALTHSTLKLEHWRAHFTPPHVGGSWNATGSRSNAHCVPRLPCVRSRSCLCEAFNTRSTSTTTTTHNMCSIHV